MRRFVTICKYVERAHEGNRWSGFTISALHRYFNYYIVVRLIGSDLY